MQSLPPNEHPYEELNSNSTDEALKEGLISGTNNETMRKPELLSQKLWRYRGVLLVSSIPVLLIFVILLLVPRSAPIDPAESLVAAKTGSIPAEKSDELYSIVIDAGSTGSRLHVFKFTRGPRGLELISDTMQKIKPGLSSYEKDPPQAALSLQPLIDLALRTVPLDQQRSTSISLKATAGLRLLDGDKADRILEEVKKYLEKTPFEMQSDAVTILDGQSEGAFAWLTINYLLGHFGVDSRSTVAAIDLGGGSVQEAFALTDEEAAKVPSGYATKMKVGGRTYNVYVHSYLGYGLMAARAKVISEANGTFPDGHPCFHKDFKGVYKYANKEYPILSSTNGVGGFRECAEVAVDALDEELPCGAVDQAECSFNGAWRGKPKGMERVYYVSSYFWDRAEDAGIITDRNAINWVTSPGDFAKKAEATCGKSLAELSTLYPSIHEEHLPYFCLDLVFCHTVLTKGFDLKDDFKLTLVKQIEYRAQNVEAAWPLGAAVNDLEAKSSSS